MKYTFLLMCVVGGLLAVVLGVRIETQLLSNLVTSIGAIAAGTGLAELHKAVRASTVIEGKENF